VSEQTHTPSPWRADIDEEGFVWNVSTEQRIICVFYSEGEIKPAKQMENAESNARLIAAAPDLLESCKSLLRHCGRYLGPLICGGDMTIARAAISKATSQTGGNDAKTM